MKAEYASAKVRVDIELHQAQDRVGEINRAAAALAREVADEVRREVVVTSDVLEGPRSRVVRQARNRMYGQMAVLYRLLAHQGEQQ